MKWHVALNVLKEDGHRNGNGNTIMKILYWKKYRKRFRQNKFGRTPLPSGLQQANTNNSSLKASKLFMQRFIRSFGLLFCNNKCEGKKLVILWILYLKTWVISNLAYFFFSDDVLIELQPQYFISEVFRRNFVPHWDRLLRVFARTWVPLHALWRRLASVLAENIT